jgi:hypothetical protein
LLRPETIELMRQRTTSFKTLFKSSEDLPSAGRGLALVVLRGGWYGTGGSAPGFQCLLRFHPSRRVGYVILSNVNAILSGGKNYESARRDIYTVQSGLVSILDPTFAIRRRTGEIVILGTALSLSLAAGVWNRWRRARSGNAERRRR